MALDVVMEMVEEHSLASYQFSVLKEVLEHHMEEEEKELLPLAKRIISKDTLVEVLDKFESVLEENMKEMKRSLDDTEYAA